MALTFNFGTPCASLRSPKVSEPCLPAIPLTRSIHAQDCSRDSRCTRHFQHAATGIGSWPASMQPGQARPIVIPRLNTPLNMLATSKVSSDGTPMTPSGRAAAERTQRIIIYSFPNFRTRRVQETCLFVSSFVQCRSVPGTAGTGSSLVKCSSNS